MDLSNALIYGDKLCCGSSEIADAKLKFSCLKIGSSWVNDVSASSSAFVTGVCVVFIYV